MSTIYTKKHRENKKFFNWRNKPKWIKTSWSLNYIEHLLILISTVTGCVFVSASASLVGIPIETTSAATG